MIFRNHFHFVIVFLGYNTLCKIFLGVSSVECLWAILLSKHALDHTRSLSINVFDSLTPQSGGQEKRVQNFGSLGDEIELQHANILERRP